MAVHRYNPGHKPPATLALVGINVAIAVIDMFSGGYLERLFWGRGIDIQYGDYWRIFTTAWVHVNLMHIAFNAYGIWLLGSIIERLHGWKPLLVIYFVALFGGAGLAMAFMDPGIPLLGASGAAYGLFGAVLGFFYAKTGSIKGILQVPMGRQLMVWLAVGVVFSLMPGISFLGHAGGFVPGAILGVYFEHRYQRELDIYHQAAAGLVLVGVLAVTAFAMFPFTRSSWYASRAMRAYAEEDFERGDALLEQARKKNMRDEGTKELITHLKLWRTGHDFNPGRYNREALLLPLTHLEPLGYVDTESTFGSGERAIPYSSIDPNKVETEVRERALGESGKPKSPDPSEPVESDGNAP